MNRVLVVVAALLLVAGSTAAQLPRGGMGGGRRGGGMGGMGGRGGQGGQGGQGGMMRGEREQNMKFPSAKALEKYNPAGLMLDKHKKLKLTDVQQDQLKSLRLQIFERNAPLMGRYDSVQRNFEPPRFNARNGSGQTPAPDSARRRSMMQMRQLRLLVDSLQEHRRADVRAVLTALGDDTQRKRAAEFLDEQDVKFSEEFPVPPQQRGGRGTEGRGGQGGVGGRGARRPPA